MTNPLPFLKAAGSNVFQRCGKELTCNGHRLCDAADENIAEFVMQSLIIAELNAQLGAIIVPHDDIVKH